MKLLSRCNMSRENNGPRKFTIELTMSGLVSLGIVVVLGLCWVFILGILLGRGYRPEAAVPQIAQMMPTTEAAQPTQEPAAPPKILKPEDLTFMDRVSDGAVVASSSHSGVAELKKISATPPSKARESTTARNTRSVTESRTNTNETKPSIYRATYQIASFPAKGQAQTMAKQLAGKGIKASVHAVTINNRKYFRVYVQIKGTEADIAKGLKKTGEKGPILLDKKPL